MLPWGHTSLVLEILLLTVDTDAGLLSILELCNNHYFYFYYHNHNNKIHRVGLPGRGSREDYITISSFLLLFGTFNFDMFSVIPGQVI